MIEKENQKVYMMVMEVTYMTSVVYACKVYTQWRRVERKVNKGVIGKEVLLYVC